MSSSGHTWRLTAEQRQRISETRKRLFAEGKLAPHNKRSVLSTFSKQRVSVTCPQCQQERQVAYHCTQRETFKRHGGLCQRCTYIVVRNPRLAQCSLARKKHVSPEEKRRVNGRKRAQRQRGISRYTLIFRLRTAFGDLRRGGKISGKRGGCFRLLPYTPDVFVAHINARLAHWDYVCPRCEEVNLQVSGYEIDHVIPLATATTEEEVLRLFELSNLDVLCRSCNRSKRDKKEDYR